MTVEEVREVAELVASMVVERLGGSLPKQPVIPPKRPEYRGLTLREVARRYRVSTDKVRGWIRKGKLKALNMSDHLGKCRFVIMPDALDEFERGRRAPYEMPTVRRRRRQDTKIDYFPDYPG